MIRILPAIVFSATVLWAQAPSARISGTIRDAGGSAVPGAEVKATRTGTATTYSVTSDADGAYQLPGLPAGSYTIEITKPGFRNFEQTGIVLQGSSSPTINAALQSAAAPPGGASAPSLSDLGFSPAQAQGSAADQARLDRRSHMLKTHQRLGLITLAPLVATLVTSNGAAGKRSTASGRDLHATLGAVTAGMYFTTASFAIFAPRVPGTTARGPIRVHRALAWIHGPGMILTPILGALAFNQLSKGEKVHGIAQAHSAVAWVTAAAYTGAMLSVSIKF